MVVRCGRCGRAVRISVQRLQKLRTFDCYRCLAVKEWRRSAGHGDDEGDLGGITGSGNLLADSTKDLTKRERSILLRKAFGFSDEEIMRAYDASAKELQDLMRRAAHLVRGHP